MSIKIYLNWYIFQLQTNAKLSQQKLSSYQRIINWNKHRSTITMQGQKWYLYYLNDPSFQGVKRFFVLSFENCTSRRKIRENKKIEK